ncbi:hypothetical protein F5B17DRAFT_241676 [Nemania serpens]|nr:hypothetical protein F5B17DRAFT_241676 [Nemania serpens]
MSTTNRENLPNHPNLRHPSPDSLTEESHEKESTSRKLRRPDMDDTETFLDESTEGSSLSNSTPGSADDYSMSGDSEDDIASDISDDVLKPLAEPLLQRLITAYSRYTLGRRRGEGEATDSNNNGVPGSTTPVAAGKQTAAGYQHPHNSSPPKRRRHDLFQNSGNDEDEDEDEELPPSKRVEPLKEGAPLACPFAKWKPLSYQSCCKYIMKDIRRVKQHLRRNHKRPLHCPICWETFNVEETFYSHIQDRSCPP